MDKQSQLRKKFHKGSFNPGASRLKLISWYFTNLLLFRSGIMPFSAILAAILRLYGAKIGLDVRIKPFINIKYPWKLSVGAHSWLGECHIENLDEVKIGRNVCVSQHAVLLTGNHDYTTEAFSLYTKPIVLEDGAWIAAGAIVCPGVKIRSHAVLLGGSIANKDLLPYTVYQGNPAQALRKRKII